MLALSHISCPPNRGKANWQIGRLALRNKAESSCWLVASVFTVLILNPASDAALAD